MFGVYVQGSALKAATMVAKHVGGKILLFSSAPPTMGEAVVKREPSREKGGAATDRETDLLKPASDAYQVQLLLRACFFWVYTPELPYMQHFEPRSLWRILG